MAQGMDDIYKTKAQLIRELIEARERIEQMARMQEELREMSVTDDLTGMFNRRGFFSIAPKQLGLCCRHERDAMLLYADVDSLKEINDSLGHTEGDLALRDVADIFKGTFRQSDIVARIGGDEFVTLMPETSESNAETIISRLKRNIEHNQGRKRGYRLSVSVGLAGYRPQMPCSVEELLTLADKSMYTQKREKVSR